MAAGSEWTRPLRRLFRPFLSRAEKEAVAQAVRKAERGTSGEIRVHIVADLLGRDPLDAARKVFSSMGLDRTRQRNGVLILIGHLDHRFAIYGDEGIHAKAGQACWDKAAAALAAGLKERRRGEAIAACVGLAGAELARHFPPDGDQAGNELSDEVTES